MTQEFSRPDPWWLFRRYTPRSIYLTPEPAHRLLIFLFLAPSIPQVRHLNVTQSHLVFHNHARMSITPVKTRQSHSQRAFCQARFFSNDETTFLVSHGNNIRQWINPATAHSGPSYPDEHVIFVPKCSPSTLLLRMTLCNSLLPKVEMRKIMHSRYGYQKQGGQQKQSASNRNNINSLKPHLIYQSMSSWGWVKSNEYQIKDRTLLRKYLMKRTKQEQIKLQKDHQQNINMLTPNQ